MVLDLLGQLLRVTDSRLSFFLIDDAKVLKETMQNNSFPQFFSINFDFNIWGKSNDSLHNFLQLIHIYFIC